MKTSSSSRVTAALLGFLAVSSWVHAAKAEVVFGEKDGWEFFADGRINAFASYGFGDGFPIDTKDVLDMNGTVITPGHTVTGGAGYTTLQSDGDNKYSAMRIRSGFVSNVFGFGVKKQVTETISLRGFIGIWTTVETFDRNKWLIVNPDAREGYFRLEGNFGGLLVGRALGLFGRGSTQINFDYGHGYGLGFPCDDKIGPTCGHVGTGVMFPGFAPGFVYSTPSLGGLQLSVGVYDPVQLLGAWERTTVLRPEAALTFDAKVSEAVKFRLFTEGVYQPLARVKVERDMTTMQDVVTNVKTSIAGVTAGGRVEAGPVRLGVAGFYGPGLGLYYALQNSPANFNADKRDLRTFDGAYAQSALVFGPLQISLGAGVARVHRTKEEIEDPAPKYSVPKQQVGISAALYYHFTDYLVFGLDYFRFQASWYLGETQNLNFINTGMTLRW